jgi:G3E family GTPase
MLKSVTLRLSRTLSAGVLHKALSTAAAATVPITTLSGFLGTGKSTLLKHLLENKQGMRIGVIVNREISSTGEIDSAPLLSMASAANEGIIQLEGGCVCCSDAAELLASIGKLQQVAAARGESWDHIIIEASGVAFPREIRNNLVEAALVQPEQMSDTALRRMVTVVDASAFLTNFEEKQPIKQRPDLGAEDMPNLFGQRPVVDLMCEQVTRSCLIWDPDPGS